jgi:hypothetical protein
MFPCDLLTNLERSIDLIDHSDLLINLRLEQLLEANPQLALGPFYL